MHSFYRIFPSHNRLTWCHLHLQESHDVGVGNFLWVSRHTAEPYLDIPRQLPRHRQIRSLPLPKIQERPMCVYSRGRNQKTSPKCHGGKLRQALNTRLYGLRHVLLVQNATCELLKNYGVSDSSFRTLIRIFPRWFSPSPLQTPQNLSPQ